MAAVHSHVRPPYLQAGLKKAYESVKAFSETDFTEDLKKFDVPNSRDARRGRPDCPPQGLSEEIGPYETRRDRLH
jgi:hypothetical protein